MVGKVAILILCVGAAALKLHADDPVDFSKEGETTPVQFSAQYRMNLIRQMQAYTIDDFMIENDKTYVKGTAEYKKRAAVFDRRKAETIRLAGLSKLTWIPAMNKFMDQTEQEIKARLGYKPAKGKAAAKAVQMAPIQMTSRVPDQINWMQSMHNSADFQKDQGTCGCGWAFATIHCVEALADIKYGGSVALSAQKLISCMPNTRHCGGNGGCDGATAELALDYLETQPGITAETTYPYTSMYGDSGSCLAGQMVEHTIARVTGHTRVPKNDLAATMYALQQGPLIVSVDASEWSFFGGGIFNTCNQNPTINHAVVMVGYGMSNGQGYWVVRNSWGKDWGENGFIRLSRNLHEENCGMDIHPEEGRACEGETQPVKACGMCGILYEPIFPIVEEDPHMKNT